MLSMLCACHRVLAHYSEDERLINLFYSKGDVYRVSLWYGPSRYLQTLGHFSMR